MKLIWKDCFIKDRRSINCLEKSSQVQCTYGQTIYNQGINVAFVLAYNYNIKKSSLYVKIFLCEVLTQSVSVKRICPAPNPRLRYKIEI